MHVFTKIPPPTASTVFLCASSAFIVFVCFPCTFLPCIYPDVSVWINSCSFKDKLFSSKIYSPIQHCRNKLTNSVTEHTDESNGPCQWNLKIVILSDPSLITKISSKNLILLRELSSALVLSINLQRSFSCI